jgi:hypothetical protein
MTSEWRKRLCGMTTAPRTLVMISVEPDGKEGTTQPCSAAGQSIRTRLSS